jgi:hypothetical protein
VCRRERAAARRHLRCIVSFAARWMCDTFSLVRFPVCDEVIFRYVPLFKAIVDAVRSRFDPHALIVQWYYFFCCTGILYVEVCVSMAMQRVRLLERRSTGRIQSVAVGAAPVHSSSARLEPADGSAWRWRVRFRPSSLRVSACQWSFHCSVLKAIVADTCRRRLLERSLR